MTFPAFCGEVGGNGSMRILKRILQACGGILLAGAIALAVSTWIFPDEEDLLLTAGDFRLSLIGAGAGLATLVLLSFANGWMGERLRRGGGRFPGTLLNALGFGFLPAAAVYKAFEQQTFLRAGKAIPEGIPAWPWVTENGACQPCRLEFALALVAFAAVVIWLALRKEDFPENGDLMGVSLALWGAVRLITESFRGSRLPFLTYAGTVSWGAAGVMLAVLLIWTRRAAKQRKNTGYAFACVPVFVAAVAVVELQGMEIITVNPKADLAILCACSLLSMKAVLCMGRVSRPQGGDERSEAGFRF